MKFVDDAKQAWRWFSVQAMAWALAIQGAWQMIPEDMKTGIPSQIVTGITMTLLALGIAGRLVDQTPKDKP